MIQAPNDIVQNDHADASTSNNNIIILLYVYFSIEPAADYNVCSQALDTMYCLIRIKKVGSYTNLS